MYMYIILTSLSVISRPFVHVSAYSIGRLGLGPDEATYMYMYMQVHV